MGRKVLADEAHAPLCGEIRDEGLPVAEHGLTHGFRPLEMDGKKDAQQENAADGGKHGQPVAPAGPQDEQGRQQGKEQCDLVDEERHKIAQRDGQPGLSLFFRCDDDGAGLCHDDGQQAQEQDVLAAVKIGILDQEGQQGRGKEQDDGEEIAYG